MARPIHGSTRRRMCGPRGSSGSAKMWSTPCPSEQIAFRFGNCLRNSAGAFQTSAKPTRSEEHTSELQSLMRISYAVFCLKKKKKTTYNKKSIDPLHSKTTDNYKIKTRYHTSNNRLRHIYGTALSTPI